MMFKIFLITLVLQLTIISGLNVFPSPKFLKTGTQKLSLPELKHINLIFPHLSSVPQFQSIVNFYMQITFPKIQTVNLMNQYKTIPRLLSEEKLLNIIVNLDSTKMEYELDTNNERYTLEVNDEGQIEINTPTYVGFLRALDTLSQIVEIKGNCYEINETPLFIQDEPFFPIRGVMIDTSRHYLSIQTIERTLDSLMLNKLNVMHWHITDDEAFPWLLKYFAQITKTGAYSDKLVYTATDIAHIIDYANSRGVQIIPEIDTPGHTWSWGKSDELSDIVLKCGVQYGQFDPTLELTYTVVKSVLQELSEVFKGVPFVHFGGDEVIKSCWDKRASIKEFMQFHNIDDYDQLQAYYRIRQKEIWQNMIGSDKQIAYWTNFEINLPVDDDDIIHWWGRTSELQAIADKPNKIILSNYDLLYLDTGFNNAFGNPYSTFHTWKEIYQNFDPFPQNISGSIIGAISALWGETNSDSTHFMKLYTRSSVLSERLWNPYQKNNEKLSDFVKRLISIEYRLESLGFPIMPTTSQYCSLNVDVCFPN